MLSATEISSGELLGSLDERCLDAAAFMWRTGSHWKGLHAFG
ncbi:hypothetical protein SynPROS71_02266 [Synechococcus sp. PROS-7-1]|nr:hypothetical protein SynPROS71_02266 [Synechococcus sp. PROS-7-1]